MAVRPIDGNALIEWFSPYLHTGEAIAPDVVIEDIRSMPTLTPPEAKDNNVPTNDPLTIEQLREMDGEPVWVTPLGFWALVIAKHGERVKLISNDGEIVHADKEIELVGPVYRRPPEGKP